MDVPILYRKPCIILSMAVSVVLFMYTNAFTTVLVVLLIYAVISFILELIRKHVRVPCADRTVLVTGCDTGFGHVLAKQLADSGVIVFAGCLHESGDGATALKEYSPERLHVLQMDVTDAAQILDCLAYVNTITGGQGLWGLVNNAGLNFLGDVELTTMEQFKRITNINQLGTVRVTKTFLPLIRHQKGRIVNVTSVKGRLCNMFNAAYSMTKYAGEAFSDVLRQEMAKFHVRVSIIEPCNFGGATQSLESNRIGGDFAEMWRQLPAEARETYGEEYLLYQPEAAGRVIQTTCTDLSLVTDAMVDALFTINPKARYLIGGSNSWFDDYKLRAQLAMFLPEWILDNIDFHFTKDYPAPQSLRGPIKNR